MKKYIAIAICMFAQAAMANPAKCHRHVAAHFREALDGHVIEAIHFTGAYKAGTELDSDGEDASFSQDGYVYTLTSNYYGGTGIVAYLVDAKCQVLDEAWLYQE